MTSRRDLVLGALVLFAGALGFANSAAARKAAPLEVTYYYMPG